MFAGARHGVFRMKSLETFSDRACMDCCHTLALTPYNNDASPCVAILHFGTFFLFSLGFPGFLYMP
jgi:hypothetical protein